MEIFYLYYASIFLLEIIRKQHRYMFRMVACKGPCQQQLSSVVIRQGNAIRGQILKMVIKVFLDVRSSVFGTESICS